MVNKELMRDTVAMIEAHPERWDQDMWVSDCGTVMCLAGWACLLSGHDPRLVLSSGRGSVRALAQELLGLTDAQMRRLFLFFTNALGEHPTIDELKERITQETGVTFPPMPVERAVTLKKTATESQLATV